MKVVAQTTQFYDSYCFNRYSYGEPIPYRFSNDAYIEKLLFPLNRNVVGNINAISFYNEPAKKFTGKYADDRHCTYSIQLRHTLLTDELNDRMLDVFPTSLWCSCSIRVDPFYHQLTVKFQCDPRGNSEVFSPGRGNLACVHYSGRKAFSNRGPLYKELSIRDDVNLLSFYAKNRLAAAGLAVDSVTGTSLSRIAS